MKQSEIYCVPRKQSIWEQLVQNKKTEFCEGTALDSVELRDREKALIQRYDSQSFAIDSIKQWVEAENPLHEITEHQKTHIENISDSKKPLFVITGQQPSLLTGPMLCIHKALTAVSLANKWENILKRPVIPIFWIAGDDSDLQECGVVEWLESKQNFASRIPMEKASDLIPMSLRKLGEGWRSIREQKQNDWSQDVLRSLDGVVDSNDTITSSAKKILQKVLGPTGILFVDGYSEKFRKLAVPTMKRVVEDSKQLESYIQNSTQKWEAQGYKAQVSFPKNTVHAFSLESTHSTGGSAYVVRRRVQSTESVNFESSSLSHDVVSRPLLIEGVFPVLGHVLGPSEMGYFLQLEEAFENWFHHRPLLSPRMTATWVSQKQFTSMQEEGIDKEQIPYVSPSIFRKQFLEQRWGQVLEEQGWKGNISSNLSGILDFLMAAGKLPSSEKYMPLFNTFKQRLERDGKWLEEKLKKSVFQNFQSEYQVYLFTLQWLAKGQGQDRHLNWFSIVNQIGENKALELLKELDPLEKQHQLLVWSSEG